MAHNTKFEEMCAIQRSLHNLTFIVDQDDDIATYRDSISKAIDEIETLRKKPDSMRIFAWAIFDGEGGYDLMLYENNESYRYDFIKANGERYKGWVTPLYSNDV